MYAMIFIFLLPKIIYDFGNNREGACKQQATGMSMEVKDQLCELAIFFHL